VKPYVIVLGNEKGGTGKSTVAMHVSVYLLNNGFKIGTIDVDARQGTFTRYIENRARTKRDNPAIPVPVHTPLFDFETDSTAIMNVAKKENFAKLVNSHGNFDFIVVDSPGTDSSLSRIAHSFADTIITPINESFIDLDLLVRINDVKSADLKPSIYAEMVWNQKKERATRDRGSIEWFVLVNRMPNTFSKNQIEFNKILTALSKRIGFRLARGFKERVVFRELFLSGLTLLDHNIAHLQTSLSHIAARQELNDLLKSLNITTND
jgi:chromosome partitioning protein